MEVQADCAMLDEADSKPQVELSSNDKLNFDASVSNSLNHIWKGGYNRHNSLFPPIYQYPFAEWIPNSIFYADFNSRLKSFDKWPKQMRPTKNDLVKSGFFYKGIGDSVECFFFCGIHLHDWETKDNAVIEHRKWSPHCKFVDMTTYVA